MATILKTEMRDFLVGVAVKERWSDITGTQMIPETESANIAKIPCTIMVGLIHLKEAIQFALETG